MTQDELEKRFASYDQRLEALEDELTASNLLVDLLIGSHHEPSALLTSVRGAIETVRAKNVGGKLSSLYDRVLARLQNIEQQAVAAENDTELQLQNNAASPGQLSGEAVLQRRLPKTDPKNPDQTGEALS
ncbi:hypothetical protein E4417_16450 [Stenotrophomonas maltophilia]|uniref:hypothetical protein n=1 Tax=Stenotrophomonas maltophilia TaxID=40324 RepID=UPI001094C5EF|nr:hypothetical protein [Stenotrophomonas maltophilia]TGW16817.1 hypothetical protein E4417_16450 [Stenotrophomonas maltophilia]